MDAKEDTKEITHITTSEGNLKRFSKICQLVGDHQLTLNEFVNKVKKSTGLTNNRVIGRHLSILSDLGFLEKADNRIFLSDEGKALIKFLEKKFIKNDELVYFEKLIFLKQILVNIKNQIRPILELSLKYRDISKIKPEYITKMKGSKRSLENRFDTFEKWLIHLDILTKTKNELKLTPKGSRLYGIIDEKDEYLQLKNYANANRTLEKKGLAEYLLDAINDYKTEAKIINYRPIRTLLCIDSMERGLFIPPSDIDDALRGLANSGKIRSVIIGRDGKPASIII